MKHYALLTVLALGSASVPALANSELSVLQRQVELSDSRIDRLEAQVAALQAQLKADPQLRHELTPPAKATGSGSYTVKSGDTISRIARKFQVSPRAIMQSNGITDPRSLSVGTKLTIPGAATEGAMTSGTPKPAAPKTKQSGTVGSNTEYVVQKGDTLYGIARRTGVPLHKIQAANPKVNPSALRPGMKLSLVHNGAAPAPKSKAKAETPAPRKESKPRTQPGTNNSQSRNQAPKVQQKQREPMPEPKFESSSDTIRTVMVTSEMTYGQFAQKHRTSIKVLNDLNGLKLTASTPLAKGSELYVPGR